MDYEDEESRLVTPEQYVLGRLILQQPDTINDHRWLWEKDRWCDLVFSILAKTSQLPETTARVITHDLEALDLIGVRTLARAHKNAAAGKASLTLKRMAELLVEAGCGPAEAQRTVAAIAEAAAFFETQYRGKVQLLFRRHGEAMLKELTEGVKFSTLSSNEAEHALVYWLQNVLGLPLSLKDDVVVEFAAEHSLAPERLIDAADSIGLNLAVLDDLIYSRKCQSKEKQGQK